MPNHAWVSSNSGHMTHEVATKQARLIDGKPLYDFEGNVLEWTKDAWDGHSELPGGKDPLGTAGDLRVFRGCSNATPFL